MTILPNLEEMKILPSFANSSKFRRFWEILQNFEEFWKILQNFEEFWEILQNFEEFWEILRKNAALQRLLLSTLNPLFKPLPYSPNLPK